MEIKVMLSAAFKEAYLELVPQFERATLVKHFTSGEAVPVIKRKGMEPV